MLYTHKELKEKLKTDYTIQKEVKNGNYFKIQKGLYSTKPNVNYLSILSKKYPYAILYGESAYYYYHLTDFIPNKITVAIPVHDKIRSSAIKQVRLNNKQYNFGIDKIKIDEDEIKIYDKERMLIELAKNKNQIGYDLYKEIVINYRKIADDLDMEKIEQYLKYYNNGDKLFDIIQDEVF